MHGRNHAATLLVATAMSLVSSAECLGASYTITDLGTLGGSDTIGFAINASGQVTGRSSVDASQHAFLYDGTMHDLGTLGGDYSQGSGVASGGLVTGFSLTAAGEVHAFLFDGAMHDLGTFGGQQSWGNGVNDSGQVVGNSDTPEAYSRPFIYDSIHGMVDLNTLIDPRPDWTFVNAYAVNNSGQIVGTSNHGLAIYDHGDLTELDNIDGFAYRPTAIAQNGLVAGGLIPANFPFFQQAFLYDGTLHELGTLGGTDSWATGVNSSGQVVGGSRLRNDDGRGRAFIYNAMDGMVDLNTLIDPLSGWTLGFAGGINDAGQITGQGWVNDESHAFLLTPVPEPSSFVLSALGLTGLAAWTWKRKRS